MNNAVSEHVLKLRVRKTLSLVTKILSNIRQHNLVTPWKLRKSVNKAVIIQIPHHLLDCILWNIIHKSQRGMTFEFRPSQMFIDRLS